MTFKSVGVNHLEGGGPRSPHRDGPEQLDVPVLVVEWEDRACPLVVSEEIVNVSSASHGNMTRSCWQGRRTRTDGKMRARHWRAGQVDYRRLQLNSHGLDWLRDQGKSEAHSLRWKDTARGGGRYFASCGGKGWCCCFRDTGSGGAAGCGLLQWYGAFIDLWGSSTCTQVRPKWKRTYVRCRRGYWKGWWQD